ncbi:Atypical/ABC1 protein kinase [Plasmodium fragile]|uniref:Atypical/ABC1 protein kinase n=1 Tax=Plasmodium fragile TaxID=5857 RepID=A0A0D9QS08_PLAFR|nr:Atypical/ABC1 protein kinase [Plasmodium fragile]KJP89854.1 Atypical/ABC1 protein kinase [Plasmodium fragile]
MPVEKKTEYWEKKHEEFATKMLNNIYELRGWWVKVGQFLSTQENIMPVAYIEKFTKLQDMMPTSSFDKIEVILKKELGNIYDIFEHIEKEPLASASIGQVHRAKLRKHEHYAIQDKVEKKNDYNVIIKIQHEGIDQFLSSDINTLKKVSWAFGLIDKNFYFTDFIDEWQDSASRELNYKYELYHQLLAYNTFKKSGIPLKIPQIYCAYTTSKVLVMEYIKGFKITDTNMIKKYKVNAYDLVYKIIDYFAYQIHNDGFFHGDPHPGNILVMMQEKGRRRKRRRRRRSKKGGNPAQGGEKPIPEALFPTDGKKENIFSTTGNTSNASNFSWNMSNAFKTPNQSNAPNASNASSASMEDFVDARYNIDRMKCEPVSSVNPFYKSFSFVDYTNNKNQEISDQVLKEDYDFILNENVSDGVSTIRKSISKSEECVSYGNSRRDDFLLVPSATTPGEECSTKLVDNENNSLHTQGNLFEGGEVRPGDEVDKKGTEAQGREAALQGSEGARQEASSQVQPAPAGGCRRKKRRTYSFVPVIIDWGLIKQLDSVMKLAFCKLVYSVSCMNVLNIIEAFEDMGFCFKEDFTYDPEIYIENLKRFFLKKLEESSNKMSEGGGIGGTAGGSGADDENANGPDATGTNTNLDVLKNMDKKEVLDQNPISDVPKDIIFFMRVASLLHGLCTQMNVNINYLSIFSRRAKEALEKVYKPIHHSIYTIPIDKTPNSFLEKRIHNLLKKLYEEKKILGCQVAIIHKKKIVVDTCVGVTSTTDKRPITRHSLFNGYSLNKAIITIALIHLMSNLVNEQHSSENVLLNLSKKDNTKENQQAEGIANLSTVRKAKEDAAPAGESDQWKDAQHTQDVQNKCVNDMPSDISKIENDYFLPVKKADVQVEEARVGDLSSAPMTRYSSIYGVKKNTRRYCSSYEHTFSSDEEDGKEEKTAQTASQRDAAISPRTPPLEASNEVYAGHNREFYEKIISDIEARQIKNFKSTINEYICNYWDGFICKNKKSITIKDVLTLKCFIKKPFQDKITLSKFIDYNEMIKMIESSRNCHMKRKSRKHGFYLYLIDTYIISELINNISGLKYYEYIYKYIIKPLNLKDEMYIPVPSYILKKHQEEMKKSKTASDSSGVNEKGKKNNYKESKTSLKKESSNHLKSNELNLNSFMSKKKNKKLNSASNYGLQFHQGQNISPSNSNYNNKPFQNSTFMNKLWNRKFRSPLEEVQIKTRSISVDVYYSSRGRNAGAEATSPKGAKNVRDTVKGKEVSGEAVSGEVTVGEVISGEEAKDEVVNGEVVNVEAVSGEVAGGEERQAEAEANGGGTNTDDAAPMNVLLNNKKIAELVGGVKFDPTSMLESNLKAKEPLSLKNKLLNHVDNLKFKTKKINDSIKNIYESNENTFLKNLFITPLKKSENDNGPFSYDYPSVELSYMYDRRLGSYTRKRNYQNYPYGAHNYYYNEFAGEDIKQNKMEKKWNIKNINKITSNCRFSEKNKKDFLFVRSNDERNKRSHSCTNYKLVQYNINKYTHRDEDGNKLPYSNNSNGIVFKYQKDTNEYLFDYNIHFFSENFFNTVPEGSNKKNEPNDPNSPSYNLEERSRLYKLTFDENIKTLLENVDAKSSGEESANSVLKEKYNKYHRRDKKYRKLFQYIKDLRMSIRERERKMREASNALVCTSQGDPGDSAVRIGSESSTESAALTVRNASSVKNESFVKNASSIKNASFVKNASSIKNASMLNSHNSFKREGAPPEMNQDFLKSVIKKDEKLLKKLIDYKYAILKKQRNNILKRKNKKNIYMNEYSDEIEMFSDSEEDSRGCRRRGNKKGKGIRKVIRKGNGKDKGQDQQTDADAVSPENSGCEMEERKLIDEKKHRLETYLVMNKLYKKNNKGFISAENHTINKRTDVYWRLAYSKRDMNFMGDLEHEDVNSTFDSILKPNVKTKRNGSGDTNGWGGKAGSAEGSTGVNNVSGTKGANTTNMTTPTNVTNSTSGTTTGCNSNLENKLKTYLESFTAQQYNEYITLFELAQAKPYVVDPLIYDSKKILDKYIPINGRFTARAMCKIMAFANNKFFFPSYIMNKMRKIYTLDESIESMILTGGMSRKWGMGFQLFECEYTEAINEDFYLRRGRKSKGKNANKEKTDKCGKAGKKGKMGHGKMHNNKIPPAKPKRIVGYGQSDCSGCLAISFPEIDLSLTILLTDIFKGATVAHMILEYVLKLYGIKPKWKLPVKVSELIKVL